jgi:hypothetical protein
VARASAVSTNRANFVTADDCGNRRRALRLNASVMQKSRDVFPLKTAFHLAEITGYSLRTCEYWLSEKVAIPSDALAALIRSEWGRQYLAAVMAETTPKWWRTLNSYLRRISVDAMKAAQEREYRLMLEEEARIHAYHAAPRHQDDDFYESLPAPPSPMAARVRAAKSKR